MKMILTAVVLCMAAISTKAQYNGIDLVNNTNCAVHVYLYGGTAGTNCNDNYVSGPILIGPTTTISIADPSLSPSPLVNGSLTLGASGYFSRIVVLHGPPSWPCTPPGVANISDCAPGGSTSVTGFSLTNGGALCPFCTNTTITYGPLTPVHSELQFN